MYELKLFFVLSVTLLPMVLGHGYLKVPPSRSSLWREFPVGQIPEGVKINYNDNQLFCGGRSHQWNSQGGKCGVCGDPYDGTRENEAGGKYASGYISRNYTQGQKINVEVKLTADHKGYFEFHLCPHNNPTVPITHECLEQYPLALEDGNYRYTWTGSAPREHYMTLQLPAQVTCSQCVLQWKYNTGNSWGCDFDDPTNCDIGLGPQEQFYGCADIAITPDDTSTPHTSISTTMLSTSSQSTEASPKSSSTEASSSTTNSPTAISTTESSEVTSNSIPESSTSSTTMASAEASTNAKTETASTMLSSKASHSTSESISMPPTERKYTQPSSTIRKGTSCVAVPPYISPGMNDWCETNCAAGNCPKTHCSCSTPGQDLTTIKTTIEIYHCEGVPPYIAPGMGKWCENNCARGFCPPTHCSCNITSAGDQGSGSTPELSTTLSSPELSTLSKLLVPSASTTNTPSTLTSSTSETEGSSTTTATPEPQSTTTKIESSSMVVPHDTESEHSGPPKGTESSSSSTIPASIFDVSSSTIEPRSDIVSSSQSCQFYRSQKNLGAPRFLVDNYCNICSRDSSCPEQLCVCDDSVPMISCTGIGTHANDPNIGQFCLHICTYYPLQCPKEVCSCVVDP